MHAQTEIEWFFSSDITTEDGCENGDAQSDWLNYVCSTQCPHVLLAIKWAVHNCLQALFAEAEVCDHTFLSCNLIIAQMNGSSSVNWPLISLY